MVHVVKVGLLYKKEETSLVTSRVYISKVQRDSQSSEYIFLKCTILVCGVLNFRNKKIEVVQDKKQEKLTLSFMHNRCIY